MHKGRGSELMVVVTGGVVGRVVRRTRAFRARAPRAYRARVPRALRSGSARVALGECVLVVSGGVQG